MSYDNKFKKRAIEYKEEGNSVRQTAKIFGISPNTLNTWIQQYRKGGKTSRKKRVYNHKITEQKLMSYLKNKPDSYQSEIAENFKCSQSTISKTLKRLNITRKKR